MQWIVGVGPGAAIAITGDATPDEVAAGVAAEAAEAAGAPLELLPPAVEEIHRSSLEKGQVQLKSLCFTSRRWDDILIFGTMRIVGSGIPLGAQSFRYSTWAPKIDGSDIKLGFQDSA